MRLRTGKIDLIVVADPQTAANGASQTTAGTAAPALRVFLRSFAARKRVGGRTRLKTRCNVPRDEKTLPSSFDTPVDEPGSRYIDFLVPGLLGMGLMGGGLWGVGFVTVDMRIRKLLKRFLATPMKKSHFLVRNHDQPAGVHGARGADPAGLLVAGLRRRDPRQPVGVSIVLILLGAGTFAGIGLLVASRARTLETVSGLMNLVMLPMWVLSGIFFNSERFPRRGPTGDSSAAAHAPDRWPAEGHARRGVAHRNRHAIGDPRRVGDRDLHSRPAVVSLVVTVGYSWTALTGISRRTAKL